MDASEDGPDPMATPLMLSRRFAPLFWCQFFSAFSDNFLKNALVFLILFKLGGSGSDALITLAAATFIAPYFFLSAFGGEMADRYDKSIIAQRLKLVEIGIAVIAVAGFWWHSILVLFFALFLFGVIGALFGPIKYGILPDHLARSELPAGNALVEGATFLAILLGTIVGGLAAKDGGDPKSFAALMLVFALACYGSGLFIPRTGEAAPDLKISTNILQSTIGLINHLRSDRRLWWGALVVSWFWLVGAVVLSLMPRAGQERTRRQRGGRHPLPRHLLDCDRGRLPPRRLARERAHHPAADGDRRRPHRHLRDRSRLGDLWRDRRPQPGRASAPSSPPRGAIGSPLDFAGLAIAGGLFIVPAFSALQAWAGADSRARVIAANNVLNAAAMVGGTMLIALLQLAGLGTSALFILIGIVSLGVAFAIGQTMPARAAADFLSIVFRAFFRVEVKGLENMQKGGHNPIIALNHVSFLDAALAVSLLGRDPVFAIDSESPSAGG